MLDRLPLELVLEIVHFACPPWVRADLLTSLSRVSKQYRLRFLPHAQSCLVVDSSRTLLAVASWGKERRHLVKTVPARGWTDEEREILDLFRHHYAMSGPLDDRVKHAQCPTASIDKSKWDRLSPYDVSRMMPLLPCVDALYAHDLGYGGAVWPTEALRIDSKSGLPFSRLRTLVLSNTQQHWSFDRVGSALEHLVNTDPSDNALINTPLLENHFSNLKTLRLAHDILPDVSVVILDRLEVIQIDFHPELDEIPAPFSDTTTLTLLGILKTVHNSAFVSRAAQYIRLEPDDDWDLRGAADFFSQFTRLRAVFLRPTKCACDLVRSVSKPCPLVNLPFVLEKLGVPLIESPEHPFEPINPEFLRFLRQHPHPRLQLL